MGATRDPRIGGHLNPHSTPVTSIHITEINIRANANTCGHVHEHPTPPPRPIHLRVCVRMFRWAGIRGRGGVEESATTSCHGCLSELNF